MILLKRNPLDDIDFFQIVGGYAYGMRFHPIYKDMRMHEGVDITRPSGTKVYLVDDGEVVVSKMQGDGKGYGEYIVVDHGEYYSLYAHLSKRLVTVGQTLKAGAVIGLVGSTGDSKGSHLHFGLCGMFFAKERGWVDPLPYMKKVEEEEEDMVRYNKVSEMPTWAVPTVKKLVEKKTIIGDEKGNLNLSEDMIRLLVILDRTGVFG